MSKPKQIPFAAAVAIMSGNVLAVDKDGDVYDVITHGDYIVLLSRAEGVNDIRIEERRYTAHIGDGCVHFDGSENCILMGDYPDYTIRLFSHSDPNELLRSIVLKEGSVKPLECPSRVVAALPSWAIEEELRYHGTGWVCDVSDRYYITVDPTGNATPHFGDPEGDVYDHYIEIVNPSTAAKYICKEY